MDEDEIQDKWIKLVAANFTDAEYLELAQGARWFLARQVLDVNDSPWTHRFLNLWTHNVTLAEEVVWDGVIVGVEHR